MKIIGTIHEPDFIESVDKYISEKCRNIESLMVELPLDWSKLSGHLNEGFFEEFARKYGERGIKIIYGDRARIIPHFFKYPLPNRVINLIYCLHQLTFFSCGKKDEGMIQAIREEKPDVVLVGRLHANHIKKTFPEAHYVAFDYTSQRRPSEKWITYLKRRLDKIQLEKPKNADEVIEV